MSFVRIVRGIAVSDSRGAFVKALDKNLRRKLGGKAIKEIFFTVSQQGVIRGLHCDLRPDLQWKLVWCISGEVFDVTLDLRRRSRFFGEKISLVLRGGDGVILVIPPGVAHGFASIAVGVPSVLCYATTSDYLVKHDGGVRWDSCGIKWPIDNPIISDRDRALPSLSDFASPF